VAKIGFPRYSKAKRSIRAGLGLNKVRVRSGSGASLNSSSSGGGSGDPGLSSEDVIDLIEQNAPPVSVLNNATVFIDPVNGDDYTAVRGDFSKPFATINAAMAVVQANDRVKFAPGTYTQTTRIQPTVSGVTFEGSGHECTIIQFDGSITSGGTAFQMYLGNGRTVVRNLQIRNPFLASASPTIGCNPSSDPGGITPEMIIEDCRIVGATDGLYCAGISGAKITAKRCVIEGNWDVIFSGSQQTIDCINCDFHWSFGNGQTQTRVGNLAGKHALINCRFFYTGDNTTGTKGHGLFVNSQEILLVGVSISNTVTGSFICDLCFAGASAYVRVAAGCHINWSNVKASSPFNRPPSIVAESGPIVVPFQIAASDLTAAATTQDISIFALPGRCAILDCWMIRTTGSGWTGTSISAVTLSVGISGTVDKYMTAQNVFTTGNAITQPAGLKGIEGNTAHSTKTTINARITTTGANVSALSGSGTTFTIYLTVVGYWVGSLTG
jgi:hypothetical protein